MDYRPAVAALCIVASLTSGCATKPTSARAKSTTEVAIESVDSALLEPCEAPGSLPTLEGKTATIGDLLDDVVRAYGLLASCMSRHEKLRSYIAPLVDGERRATAK